MKKKRSNRGLLSVLCIIVFLLFILYFISLMLQNDSPPYISIDADSDMFSVELHGEDLTQALMAGVTASDPEDGDVTDSIIIESISTFDSNAINETPTYTRTVTYVAFDSANNVTKLSRDITYTDYRSPVITADRDLIFTVGVSEAAILSHLHCIDVIDGDISENITLQQNSTLQTSIVGTQTLIFEVTNSCGETVYATFPVELIS